MLARVALASFRIVLLGAAIALSGLNAIQFGELQGQANLAALRSIESKARMIADGNFNTSPAVVASGDLNDLEFNLELSWLLKEVAIVSLTAFFWRLSGLTIRPHHTAVAAT